MNTECKGASQSSSMHGGDCRFQLLVYHTVLVVDLLLQPLLHNTEYANRGTLVLLSSPTLGAVAGEPHLCLTIEQLGTAVAEVMGGGRRVGRCVLSLQTALQAGRGAEVPSLLATRSFVSGGFRFRRRRVAGGLEKVWASLG